MRLQRRPRIGPGSGIQKSRVRLGLVGDARHCWKRCRLERTGFGGGRAESGSVERLPGGLESLELKKEESEFVQWIKPLFPFIKDWTLVDKSLTTLSMLCVIRGLYFMPIYGIHPRNLQDAGNLASLEQKLLEKLFMAEESVPLNVAMLGISPIVFSGFLIQFVLTSPVFSYIKTPYADLINKKLWDIERTSFRTAMAIGLVMAINTARELQRLASGAKMFFATVVIDLMAALCITRFCCNIIQHKGFGEGTGFLLLALTLSGFGKKLWWVGASVTKGAIPIWKVGVVFVCYVAIVAVCALFNEVQVRLPLTDYSMKSSKASDGGRIRMRFAQSTRGAPSIARAPYFPLPIAQMAISALFLTSMIFGALSSYIQRWPAVSAVVRGNVGQILLFSSIAFFLALLPIGETTPDMAKYLSALEMGIKGVLPGDPTVRHLKRCLFQNRFLGACALFFIISACMWLDVLCDMWLGTALGTLNLILLVAVISTAFKTMEAHVDSRRVEEVTSREKRMMKLLEEN